MKKAIKTINKFFIEIILLLFYFLVIGFGALIYRITKKDTKTESFWKDFTQKEPEIDYFKSAY